VRNKKDAVYTINTMSLPAYMLTDVTHLVAPSDNKISLHAMVRGQSDLVMAGQVCVDQLHRVCTSNERWDQKGLAISQTLQVLTRDFEPGFMAAVYLSASESLGQPVSPVSVHILKALLDAGYRDPRYQSLTDELPV
jgi:hypothetical protein